MSNNKCVHIALYCSHLRWEGTGSNRYTRFSRHLLFLRSNQHVIRQGWRNLAVTRNLPLASSRRNTVVFYQEEPGPGAGGEAPLPPLKIAQGSEGLKFLWKWSKTKTFCIKCEILERPKILVMPKILSVEEIIPNHYIDRFHSDDYIDVETDRMGNKPGL